MSNLAKKYYWLKIEQDFFRKNRALKKMRHLPGGAEYVLIYMEMLLQSMQDDGKYYYEGVEDSIAEEIAIDIDESPEAVAVTISLLVKYGLMEVSQDDAFLTQLPSLVGGESDSAERVRKFRERQKAITLQCNATPLLCNNDVTECNTEKRRDREDIEIEKENNTLSEESVSVTPTKRNARKPKAGSNIPPTVEEVREYCQTRGNSVDAERFCDFYESKGWKVGKEKMKNWQASVRTWENKDKSPSSANSTSKNNSGATGEKFQVGDDWLTLEEYMERAKRG